MSETLIDVRRQWYRRRCSEMASSFMMDVLGNTPYQWQTDVISHMAMMPIPGSGVDCAPVLLVRPTGGGKSSVRDVYSLMNCGVSLTISPLLSLGADQEEKLKLKANQAFGAVCPIHIDEFRSVLEQKKIVERIKLLVKEGHTTVYLFSSPQAIVKNDIWCGLVDYLIDQGQLSMVCVDELHLFAHFGMTFRKEFQQLDKKLFAKLRVGDSRVRTKVPILFMTATCTSSIVDRIEEMTRLSFNRHENVFWPGPNDMGHRHVFLDVVYTTNPIPTFQKRVFSILKTCHVSKFIVYTNTRRAVKRETPKLAAWIDKHGLKSDLLMIIGTLQREQKFYHIRKFTQSNAPNASILDSCSEETRPFNPQILTATSGAANAGIDDPEVFGVCRTEFPPSVLDVKQEKGRAGRRPTADPSTDWYLLCISLESIVILLKRLWDTSVKDNSYFKTQENDIRSALKLFVLPTYCLQATLECNLSNPYFPTYEVPDACGDACSYCTGKYPTMFPRLIQSGVRTVLLQLFVGANAMPGRPSMEKEFVDAIRKFDSSNRLLFGVNSNKKPEPILVKKMIVMLLAANILDYTAERKVLANGTTSVTIYASLGFVAGDPTKLALDDDSYFEELPLK
jgi:superfamily II DNA helicase RecQ